MGSLQTLLAVFSIRNLPKIVMIAGIVFLVLAFVYGYVKGVRKISKMGISLAVAGVGFLVVYKFLYAKVPFTWAIGKNKTDISDIAWGFILLVGCVVAVLLLTALCMYLFRPVKNSPSKRARDDRRLALEDYYEAEYDVEDINEEIYDYDEEIEAEERRARMQLRFSQTGILSRISGGLCCMVNVALILALVVSVFVFAIDCTKLANGRMNAVFEGSIGRFALKYVSRYALDFITVSIVFLFAYRGYKVGVVGLTHTLLCRVGIIAVVIFSFVMPFMAGVSDFVLIRMLINAFAKLFGKIGNPTLLTVLSKLGAGLVIASVGAGIVWGLCYLLMKLIRNIENTEALRVIDGVLAVVVYLALGIAICCLFWGGLYVLDASGLFRISETFGETASLSKECFSMADRALGKFVSGIKG